MKGIMDTSHLPAWASKAIDDYEAKVADGTLTFTGEFADEPPDARDGWVGSHLAGNVSAMDIS